MSDEARLAALLEEGAIDEVLGQLQAGKEASLYLVRRHGEVVAAKIYKARDRRTFRNRAVYTEGREVMSTRDVRALARRSAHGKAVQEGLWKAAESETLTALHRAGVRVPRPIAFTEGVLLMSLVTDARGEPAPRLIDTRPSREDAARLHETLVGEITKMLAAGWIHGDLSAYNVLASAEGPVLIDFPQAVSASHNSQARRLLVRDVQNVTAFLAGFDPSLSTRRGEGEEIWRRYERGELGGASASPGARPDEPEDALAKEIAAAKLIPHGVARARGRRVAAGEGAEARPREASLRGQPSREASLRGPPPREASLRGQPSRGALSAAPSPRRDSPPPRRDVPSPPDEAPPSPRPDASKEGKGAALWDLLADRYRRGT